MKAVILSSFDMKIIDKFKNDFYFNHRVASKYQLLFPIL